MAIKVNGAVKRIGLAMSGGGFRAAAFHLGVMRKLDAMGILGKLDLVSCVSGGSIAGATLVTHWANPSKALDILDEYLRTKSIAVSSVIGGILDPFESRLDKLARTYARDLFGERTLSSLANGPRTYFNATNLATGNMFSFVAGRGESAEMGDYELGFITASDFRISRAVAASSAFPPVFPPLRLGPDEYPPAENVEYVTLTDGGVYDNMGVNPTLRRNRNPIDYVIVSDGGKPFAVANQPTESGSIVLKAALDIMMEQVRGLQFDRIQHRYLANLGAVPLWFSIDSREGEANPGDASSASSISTHLKKLSQEEMAVLTRHGGALLASRIDRYAPELKGAS